MKEEPGSVSINHMNPPSNTKNELRRSSFLVKRSLKADEGPCAEMRSASWMLVPWLLLCSEGSQQKTKQEEAKTGDDVLLWCQGSRDGAVEVLEWVKPDLKSDDYVFFLRDNQIYDDYQHPSFRSRVRLRDPEMTDGDFSVVLKDVTLHDAGSYECRVRKSSSERRKRATPELITSIKLKVQDSALVQTHITTDAGNRVTLPCRAGSSSSITALEWVRPDKVDFVFWYRDGRSHPEKQHPYYKNWVELQDEHMEDGDVSLTVIEAMNIDSGMYECWVNQDGTKRQMGSVQLHVRPSGPRKGVGG
ncbi:coxsackievirus and adenovirus receptor homolog [Betta splendens]|uniref:Coxsackievirus and adenovirus receptor homolog n=1 Tax=Betta splendens TaxID=158456 RepID=A0A9W2XMZ5_BETSP|nr:coxsackievirus and adenovirus receptor homolog [Betta splendens]